MTKMKFLLVLVLVSFMFSGCSSTKMLLDDTSKLDSIDKVQIALAMGNPEYGAESKIITDKDEIKELVDAFNNAIVGEEVKTGEIYITSIASYYFYSDGSLVQRFIFNGNNTEHIFLDSKCYYVKYPDKTPYELYQQSKAEIITVDEELNEMKR